MRLRRKCRVGENGKIRSNVATTAGEMFESRCGQRSAWWPAGSKAAFPGQPVSESVASVRVIAIWYYVTTADRPWTFSADNLRHLRPQGRNNGHPLAGDNDVENGSVVSQIAGSVGLSIS